MSRFATVCHLCFLARRLCCRRRCFGLFYCDLNDCLEVQPSGDNLRRFSNGNAYRRSTRLYSPMTRSPVTR
ncbi:hypothetical protein KPH14_002859 [Odynerus spinipes]|uniref:Uncharacterized protein n=1 Tax=Odynerus spinipes TaxID=1348599 RepID=A0AAD9VU43_9HYME|nr:hypothetical protein KPH14_002859 [Odynerus spinipes]